MADHGRATNTCPICKKIAEQAFRPFCSKRCANLDLFNWFNGEYALPVTNSTLDEEYDPFDELPQGDRSN